MKPRVLNVGLPEPSVAERTVEELVYQRLRLAVDFCELLTFHEDLASSVARALARSARPGAQKADLTMHYVRMAWDRLGEEVLGQLAQMSLPGAAE